MRRAWSRGVLCRAPHPNGKASMTESRHKDREQATAPTANREPEPELTAEVIQDLDLSDDSADDIRAGGCAGQGCVPGTMTH